MRGACNGITLCNAWPGVYGSLLLAESTEKELEIVRDLSRTYPSHVYYQQRQGPGQRSLFNVLKAYSVYDSQAWHPAIVTDGVVAFRSHVVFIAIHNFCLHGHVECTVLPIDMVNLFLLLGSLGINDLLMQ